MKLRSPVAAILWEIWRVTRVEAAWRLAFGIVGGLAALALGATVAPADEAAALAMTLLVLAHLVPWLSLGKLNSGRTGFPLYLHYSRPVRTAVMVGLPMAYLTTLSSAIYLVSAVLLRVTSGHAFPLLPVVAWVAALTVVFLAAGWSIRDRTIPVLVWWIATVCAWGISVGRLTAVELPDGYDWPPRLWPTLFDWPVTDYAWIALIGLASFAGTVVMVTRQRRGDELSFRARAGLSAIGFTPSGGWWGLLVDLFRFPCPTSSAMRAQVWLDLKSTGLPVLTIGVAFASGILLVSAVSGPIDAAINANPDVPCPIKECFYWRAFPNMLTPAALFAMLCLGGNAFGIRRKQGRTSMSAFEATRAYGTAHLAMLKLLVKSVCVLTALTAIAASFWISIPILGDAVFIQMWGVPFSSRRSVITDAFAAMTWYEQIALAVVTAGGVALWVASWAALGALWTRYPRRLTIATSLLLLYGVALALLALAAWRGIGPEIPLGAIVRGTSWVAAASIVFATAYFGWRTIAERLLTVRQASVVVFLSVALAAAWLTMLRVAGLSLADMPAADGARILSLALLPLTIGVLAPWSYGRLRSW
jgi:hypothetical protein